jgi:hypothetical protein
MIPNRLKMEKDHKIDFKEVIVSLNLPGIRIQRQFERTECEFVSTSQSDLGQ